MSHITCLSQPYSTLCHVSNEVKAALVRMLLAQCELTQQH